MSIDRVPSNTTMTNSYENIRINQQNSTNVKEINLNGNSDIKNRESNVNVSEEKLREVVTGLNDFLNPTQTSLKFELHDKLNEYYVTIVDDATKEVVREIPSKKLLDMYATMTEIVGFIVDKKI
jgi:flagellar protein FlaG